MKRKDINKTNKYQKIEQINNLYNSLEYRDVKATNYHTIAFADNRIDTNASNYLQKHQTKQINPKNIITQFEDREAKKQRHLSMRIKTLQQTIQVKNKKIDKSVSKFLRKDLNISKQIKNQHQSRYFQKQRRKSYSFRSYSKVTKNDIIKSNIPLGIYNKQKQTYQVSQNDILQKGREIYRQGKFSLAISCFHQLLKMNPYNLEGHYLLAVAYLNKHQFNKALQYFNKILILKQDYNKNVFILSAISYKKLKMFDQCEKKLNQCITLFPQTAEAYLYRAKLKLNQGTIESAFLDFEVSQALQPQRYHNHVGKGDCYVLQRDYTKALVSYDKAKYLNAPTIVILQKIATCYYSLLNFKQSLNIINRIIELSPKNFNALFFKAKILSRLKNNTESNLIFDELLLKNDEKYNSKILQQMIRIKISQRDFYSAQHILTQQYYLNIDIMILEKVKMFIQAVVFMMKKDFLNGAKLLQQLGYKNKYFEILNDVFDQTDQFLKPLISLYIAYAYFCLNQFKSSLKYYQLYICVLESKKKQNKITIQVKYNMQLCQGLIYFENKQFQKSLQTFVSASQILKTQIQPFFYQALCLLQIYYQQQTKNKQKINQAITILSSAIKLFENSNVPNLFYIYYFQSALFGYIQMWKQCIFNCNKASQKSQQNQIDFLYLRAIAFASCDNFSQAIEDLSNCLNMAPDFSKAYLLRAKCFQLSGQTNEAFSDLQKYITLKPQDPFIHKYAGHLLFESSLFQDSIVAYSHGQINQQQDLDLFSTRAKAYLLLGEFQLCLKDLQKQNQKLKDERINIDIQFIEIIKNINEQCIMNRNLVSKYFGSIQSIISSNIQGKIFKKKQYLMLKGALLVFLQQYQQSVIIFYQCLRICEKDLHQQIKQNKQVSDNEQLEEYYQYCNFIKYNISLCYLLNKKINLAYEIAEKMIEVKNKSQWSALFWKKIIRYQIGGQIDQESKRIISQQDYQEVFSQKTKLSKHFPLLSLDLKIKSPIKFKLCLPFPKVQPPDIKITFDDSILFNIKYSDIDMKPQAPWIRKGNNYIIFTSQIQTFDNFSLDTQSLTNKSNSENQSQFEEIIEHKLNNQLSSNIKLLKKQ